MTNVLFPFVWMFLVFFKGFDGNSSLRFSFDLTLPGKRASRKGPSTKKVWQTILVHLRITQSALRLLVADSFRNFIPVLVDRGHARLLGEPQLSVLQPRGSWEHRPAQAVSIYAISWQKSMFMNPEFLLNLLSLSVSHQSLSRSVLISFSPSLLCYFPCIPRFCSHVMKELIETERIYVDELLSVLLVMSWPNDLEIIGLCFVFPPPICLAVVIL